MSDLLTVKNLNKSFASNNLLVNLSFSLKKGKITALMAPSGAGKTTLLRILAGLDTPDSGRIEAGEQLLFSVVFQEDRLCENLNPISNIRLVTGNTISKAEILKAFSALGLAGCESRPVRELSGGERRRIVLLRALLAPWNLLLLDEPFKGLDPGSRKKAMDYVLTVFHKNRYSAGSRTILFVTHDPFEAEYLADDILTL